MAFFKQKKLAFGLDVSNTSIKIFQFEKKGKGYKVLAYTNFPLRKGIMVNDTIIEEKNLGEQIKAAAAKLMFGKVNTNLVLASIPESKAFVRVIQVPKIEEEKAGLAVSIEAEQYIPIPLDQAYLDWQIIGDSTDGKMDVLVSAAPKDYIDVFVRVLKAAGLRPIGIEVGSAAVARALVQQQNKDKDLLIVDVGAFRTSLIVVSKLFLQFTTSVPIAGDAFNQAIARALGANEQQAEAAKIQYGLDPASANAAVRTALVPVVDNLVEEIRNILKFHEAHSTTQITEVLLSGGGVRFPGFIAYLQEKLAEHQVQVTLGNPWVNVFDSKTAANPKLAGGEFLGYSAAIGLALRGTDMQI